MKAQAGIGSPYPDQYELICVFRAGRTLANDLKLVSARSNLWTYRELNVPKDVCGNTHRTAMPEALIADVLRETTKKRNAIVLDTFVGWGSTLLAAEETGWRCFGIEFNPRLVDVAIRRWELQTKVHAVDAQTGKPFSERKLRRHSEARDAK